MKNAKRAVQQVARENFDTYSEDWLSNDDLQGYSVQVWEVRNDLEIQRDEKEGVTEDDYYDWIEEAFTKWFSANAEEHGVSDKEKEMYLEHIHRVGYDSSFEMFKHQWIEGNE